MHLFGPVLRYDLVCTARRARYFVMRFFYALLLFLTLYIFYIVKLRSVSTEKVAQKLLIDFAELFSYVYLLIQYILVLIMTPAYVGSAVAEEKERRTLEFLLATDLRSQEIIFGKLASRVGNLLMFLLAGLPVLAFVLFYGGVDPELLKNGFLATLATVFSISAVSLYCSVHARYSREGIIRSYFMVVGYFIFSIILIWLVSILKGSFAPGLTWSLDEADPTTRGLCYFTEYFLTGNVFHAIYLYIASFSAPWLGNKSFTGVDLGTSMNDLLRNYLIFHGSLTILCLLLSVWQLRSVFLKQVYGESRRRRRLQVQPAAATNGAAEQPRPEPKVRPARGWRWKLGKWPPMVWKELLVPRQSKRTLRARLLTGLVWAVYLLPAAILFMFASNAYRVDWHSFSISMHYYALSAGTICLCLMVFSVGIRAANAICYERDRQTLETLLSTELTDRQIVVGKWLGALFGHGPSIYLLLLIWIICLFVGALNFTSVFMLAGAFLVYCGFASALGLFFSAGARTTTRSLLATLFWLVIWMGGHWVFIGLVLLFTTSGESRGIMDILIGMTPPAVFVIMTQDFYANHREPFAGSDYYRYAMVGLAVNVMLTLLFLALARQRFYLNTGRIHNLEVSAEPVPVPPLSQAPQ